MNNLIVDFLSKNIQDYPDVNDKNIQYKIWEYFKKTDRYAFLSNEKYIIFNPNTTIDYPYGKFFMHQDIIGHLLCMTNRLFLIHEPGMGKTGCIIRFAEHCRSFKNTKSKNLPSQILPPIGSNIRKIYVFVRGKQPKQEFTRQLQKIVIVKDRLNDFYKLKTIRKYYNHVYKKYSQSQWNNYFNNKFSDCILFFDEVHEIFSKDSSHESPTEPDISYNKHYTTNSSKDYTINSPKDSSNDSSNDYTINSSNDYNTKSSKDYTNVYTINSSNDFSKDLSKDSSKDYTINSSNDYNTKSSKDYTNVYTINSSKDLSKDSSKDYTINSSKDYTINSSKDYSKDSANDYTINSSKDYRKDKKSKPKQDDDKNSVKDLYTFLFDMLHCIDRSKVVFASGTPVKSDIMEFIMLINLLLPLNKQMNKNRPLTTYHHTELEYYLRGLISYIANKDRIAEPEYQGNVLESHYDESDIYDFQLSENMIESKNNQSEKNQSENMIESKNNQSEKNQSENMIESKNNQSEKNQSENMIESKNNQSEKNQSENMIESKNNQSEKNQSENMIESKNNQSEKNQSENMIESKKIIYASEMSDFQTLHYENAMKRGNINFWIYARQTSDFVFPDGSSGKDGFDKYIYQKNGVYYAHKELIPYLSDIHKLEKLSVKYASIIRESLNSKGCVFIYTWFVDIGAIILDLVLQHLNIEKFLYQQKPNFELFKKKVALCSYY
jgi:hypothetical protein